VRDDAFPRTRTESRDKPRAMNDLEGGLFADDALEVDIRVLALGPDGDRGQRRDGLLDDEAPYGQVGAGRKDEVKDGHNEPFLNVTGERSRNSKA